MYGVKPQNIVERRGERWTAAHVHVWSDAESGLVRESYSQLPVFYGWTIERVRSRNDGTLYTGQVWDQTNEVFYCEAFGNQPEISLGALGTDPSKFRGSFLGADGTRTIEAGEEVLHFKVKSKEHEAVYVDYFVTDGGASDGKRVLYPYEFVMHIVPREEKPGVDAPAP